MFDQLSTTELKELIRKKIGRRIDTNNRDELLNILENKTYIEASRIEKSRMKLQMFVEKNLVAVQTNLPCHGQLTAGKCMIHPCTDYTHYNCLIGAQSLMKD